MQTLTQPTLLLKPFAESGDKNSIPVTNTDVSNPQLADLTNGFPQITSLTPDNGGLPPERKDFNGLGFLTTSYDWFYQAGGTFTFNPTISTAIGGYPLGARLWYTDSNGFSCILRSTIQNNTNNFLTDPTVIGQPGDNKPWEIENFKGLRSPLNLFDFKWSDYELNDQSWLRADTFSWQDGTVYTNAYNHLVDDYTNGTSQTETVGSYTISYMLAPDGHKIVYSGYETTVQNIYNESGAAWYYILDTTNQRFKLPRINPAKEVLGVNAPVSVYGNGKALGLTNGTTNYGLEGVYGSSYLSMATGAYDKNVSTGASQQGLNGAGKFGVTTDSSKSGIVGQANLSNTSGVYKGNKYLYFYVGEFSTTATEQTAGLNSGLFNGKVDLDLDNMNPSATSKQTIVGWGMPDYNSLISVGNTTRTPTSNVVVFCDLTGVKTGSISFSGRTFNLAHSDAYGSTNHVYREFYIPKGTQYTTNNLSEVFEVPLIGG